jgi:hypothetical protein
VLQKEQVISKPSEISSVVLSLSGVQSNTVDLLFIVNPDVLSKAAITGLRPNVEGLKVKVCAAPTTSSTSVHQTTVTESMPTVSLTRPQTTTTEPTTTTPPTVPTTTSFSIPSTRLTTTLGHVCDSESEAAMVNALENSDVFTVKSTTPGTNSLDSIWQGSG